MKLCIALLMMAQFIITAAEKIKCLKCSKGFVIYYWIIAYRRFGTCMELFH